MPRLQGGKLDASSNMKMKERAQLKRKVSQIKKLQNRPQGNMN